MTFDDFWKILSDSNDTINEYQALIPKLANAIGNRNKQKIKLLMIEKIGYLRCLYRIFESTYPQIYSNIPKKIFNYVVAFKDYFCEVIKHCEIMHEIILLSNVSLYQKLKKSERILHLYEISEISSDECIRKGKILNKFAK